MDVPDVHIFRGVPTHCRVPLGELAATTVADDSDVRQIRVLLLVGVEVDEAVQDIEGGKGCVVGMASLATWLPRVQVVPRQLVLLVLARVVFLREELRGEDCDFALRPGEVILSSLGDGVVHRLPVGVSIPEPPMENNKEVLNIFVFYILVDESWHFLVAVIINFERREPSTIWYVDVTVVLLSKSLAGPAR